MRDLDVVCGYLVNQRKLDIFEFVQLYIVVNLGVSPWFFVSNITHFALIEKPLLKWDEGEIFICLDYSQCSLLEYLKTIPSSKYSED